MTTTGRVLWVMRVLRLEVYEKGKSAVVYADGMDRELFLELLAYICSGVDLWSYARGFANEMERDKWMREIEKARERIRGLKIEFADDIRDLGTADLVCVVDRPLKFAVEQFLRLYREYGSFVAAKDNILALLGCSRRRMGDFAPIEGVADVLELMTSEDFLTGYDTKTQNELSWFVESILCYRTESPWLGQQMWTHTGLSEEEVLSRIQSVKDPRAAEAKKWFKTWRASRKPVSQDEPKVSKALAH